MECNEARQSLGAYLDQELTDDQVARLEAHLKDCEGCRQELDEVRDLCMALDDPELQRLVLNEPSPLPADFTAQVMSSLLAEQPRGVNIIWPWLRRKWSHRQYASVAYAMSATLVVVSAGELLLLWNQTTDQIGIWLVQGQAYWEAVLAFFGGISVHLSSFWQAFVSMAHLG